MKISAFVVLLSGCLLLGACGGGSGGSSPTPTPPPNPTPTPPPVEPPPAIGNAKPQVNPEAIAYNDMAVHDPSIIRAEDGTYYVFGSHLSVAKSDDVMQWTRVADGVDDNNPLFDTVTSELADGIAYLGGTVGQWAADVIRLNDGRYYFYYNHCGNPHSTVNPGDCDAPRSYMGVAVADHIEGPYRDLGLFLYSGQTSAEIAAGLKPDGFTGSSFNAWVMPNAIDPHAFYDKEGRLWLVYGSYSGGIFILEMDESTAKPTPGQGYGKHLAGGNHSAIEGTWIIYSPEADYYYLFMSFGGFVSTDGYNIRLARSRNPDGPYVDAEGRDLANAKGGWDAIAPFGVKLMGGFEFVQRLGDSAPGWGYMAPGHNSAYYDADTGSYQLVTHTRFPGRGEQHSVRVHSLFINDDDWLVASPQRYAPLSGDNIVGSEEMLGDYLLVNHRKDINRQPHASVYISLTADGTIQGAVTGSYQRYANDPRRITLQLTGEDDAYEGVLVWQWDESRRELLPGFTAVNRLGVSLWGTGLPPQTTQEVLASIADALALPEVVRDSQISLPVQGLLGATIAWTSSHPQVIDTSGNVQRPAEGSPDQQVTLTALISLDGETLERSFSLLVPARNAFNVVAQFDFEQNLDDSRGGFAAGQATGDRLWKLGEAQVSYEPGYSGSALRLDGTNGVRLPAGLITSYEYTVSLWIKPNQFSAFSTAFFAAVDEQQDPAGNLFSDNWLSLVPQSWDGNTMLWGRVPQWFDGTTGSRIPQGEWTHLAFSVNRGEARVYVNGELRFSASPVADLFSQAEGRFALGVNYWDTPFDGLIDSLQIFDQPLSADDITSLYTGAALP